MDTRCPHYLKILITLCRADGKIYAPNYLEQHEYCRSGDHPRCPLFMKRAAQDKNRGGEDR